jgi:hypothetical protein
MCTAANDKRQRESLARQHLFATSLIQPASFTQNLRVLHLDFAQTVSVAVSSFVVSSHFTSRLAFRIIFISHR